MDGLSRSAIHNLNILIKLLKIKLKNNAKDCDVYTTDELVTFLASALSMFNQTPIITCFSWEDSIIIEKFHDILVQGAFCLGLGALCLIEQGKDLKINDNVTGFVSELLNSKYSKEIDCWYEKCKNIKQTIIHN